MDSAKAKRILFLGEQDGQTERNLKQELSVCLSNQASVLYAFLMRVSYHETPGVNVALVIVAEDMDRTELLPCLEAAFQKLFLATQHMDILFLSPAQLTIVNAVANPFYTSATSKLLQ